jgi:hypothetical protein
LREETRVLGVVWHGGAVTNCSPKHRQAVNGDGNLGPQVAVMRDLASKPAEAVASV